MRIKMKRFLGILLSLALILGLMPGMSLTAYADDKKAYADYDVTTDENKTKSGDDLTALQVKFNEMSWYIIEDNSTAVNVGTVTLLAAESLGKSKFYDSGSSNKYSTSRIKTTLDNMTASDGSFAGVASAISTVKVKGSDSDTEVDAKLYLLNKTEANNLPQNVRKFSASWWLRSPGTGADYAAIVRNVDGNVIDEGAYVTLEYGVRPALKLNLSSVIFSSETNTFTVESAAIEPVSYMEASVDGTTHVVTFTDKSCTDYTVVDSNTTTWGTAGTTSWYVVNSDVTIDSAITFTGDVHLILCDGVTLTVNNNVKKSEDTNTANLTIYGQDAGTGALNVTSNGTSAINNNYTDISNYDNNSGGNIKINGGKITASATGTNGHGIFAKGDITINGGEVNAEAIAQSNAGIWASGGTVTINGGKITAKVTNGGIYGTGILGSGVIISDGEVIAVGNYRAIDCNVKNEIAGTGWTNVEGTEGHGNIAISTEGQSLESYKKVQFPDKNPATVTTAPTAKSLTYTGKAQELVAAGEATGGEMQYALGNATEATQPYTISIPTATNVGTYYVWYKVKADNAHTDSNAFCVKVTISPKTVEPENPVETEKTVPMYRLFNKGTLEHLYTDSKRERDVLTGSGWIYEGIAWYAPEKSKTPVYRLYNPILNDHHYTIDAHERDVLSTKHGWIYEGIGWYSDDSKTVPIYRRFYPFITSGSHHYTNSLNEAKHLAKVGWIDEGIGWYGAAEK